MNLSFLRNVSESTLQGVGLATADEWAQPCFSTNANRLVLLDGKPVGAVVTKEDFGEPSPGGVAELVAVEVLPRFRRQGIARSIVRHFAKNGVVRVNSPSEAMIRTLTQVAALSEIEPSIFEVQFRQIRH